MGNVTVTRFGLLIGILAICLPLVASPDQPPTYKGLVCIGWSKPESQALADGDSSGEEMVVNTPLTEKEKRELYFARQEESAAIRKAVATENAILSHHHLLFPPANGVDSMRAGPCGDTPMIREDEYHITQFVPTNPKYPGDDNFAMMAIYHADSAKCRGYFAELRKRAVKAKYGADAGESYFPTTSKPD